MQMNSKTSKVTKAKTKEKLSKDDQLNEKNQKEKLKKSVVDVSTPRNFVQKSSTSDIYAQKKKNAVQATKAPKEQPGTTNKSSNVSPMKDLLKSSSSVSQISTKFKNGSIVRNEVKIPNTARHATPRTGKDLPILNVTVNSPPMKRKIIQDGGKTKEVLAKSREKTKEVKEFGKEVGKKDIIVDSKDEQRHRTKTRTLNENEIKVLTPDAVDNNAEMKNLTRKLAAKPKAFYVDLDDTKEKVKNDKQSEDEVSYEDDFESYESDFESEQDSESTHKTNEETDSLESEENANGTDGKKEESRLKDGDGGKNTSDDKDLKDEEKMLDSGNFDLRDARSANKKHTKMEYISEDAEMDVRSSLTDEGFQDMSTSAVNSIKTVHIDILDRPLFIDFTKSKENKREKKIFETLKQRARDILSMVSLHEMTYSLYEMNPIRYDLYMTTYGRANYSQNATQTFDDGVDEEVQTEKVMVDNKWTQNPVKFSKNDIYLKPKFKMVDSQNEFEDYLTKFSAMFENKTCDSNKRNDIDENYKINPLRIYFEQKDGVGACEMLPLEKYESILKSQEYNVTRLGKFLKNIECKICSILSENVGLSVSCNIKRTSKFPFSRGYTSLTTESVSIENMTFLKRTKIISIVISETKSNLIFTIHSADFLLHRCVACLWDVNISTENPLKVLISINRIDVARYNGNTDGTFVAALEDGSLHVWDLSEKPQSCLNIDDDYDDDDKHDAKKSETSSLQENDVIARISHEPRKIDPPLCYLQPCAYTTSASGMQGRNCSRITSLTLQTNAATFQGGRKLIGQICSLQRVGIITIWSLIQCKTKETVSDIGKAFWSKIHLEKKQTISLADHLSIHLIEAEDAKPAFNLNAAKVRMSQRKKEKSLQRQLSRSKSNVKFDRPASAAISKNSTKMVENKWENGLICNDLKVMRVKNDDCYLVAKNCGEVLCCTKNVGTVKVKTFCVATDLSTVTRLEVSTHSPHFLAATETGTVSLCSLDHGRVLLTLDCRNRTPQDVEKYQVDSKGRFLGSATRSAEVRVTEQPNPGVAVCSVVWLMNNPCCILVLQTSGTLVAWDLTKSDINAISSLEKAASIVCSNGDAMAVLTKDGEVQIHRLECGPNKKFLELFQRYVALL